MGQHDVEEKGYIDVPPQVYEIVLFWGAFSLILVAGFVVTPLRSIQGSQGETRGGGNAEPSPEELQALQQFHFPPELPGIAAAEYLLVFPTPDTPLPTILSSTRFCFKTDMCPSCFGNARNPFVGCLLTGQTGGTVSRAKVPQNP